MASGGAMYGGYWSPIYSFSEKRHVVFSEWLEVRDESTPIDKPYVTFEQEYNNLPRGQEKPWTVAALYPQLNRVSHLVAYDDNRVKVKHSPLSKLTSTSQVPVTQSQINKHSLELNTRIINGISVLYHSYAIAITLSGYLSRFATELYLDVDYINASYIDGYSRKHSYIATTSPFSEECTYQFWQMIYEQNVSQIVMVCVELVVYTINCVLKCATYYICECAL